VVIKLGTYILTRPEDGTIATSRLRSLVRQCAALKDLGKSVIVVSSGAVGLGRSALGLEKVTETADKQACAAVGQSLLMKEYQRLFSRHGLIAAQVLVTAGDFSDRRRYLTLRQAFERLLSYGVVPVVNENDTVSAMEIREDARTHSFGDNDLLSALVASKLGADLLLILTNVGGVYDSNPDTNEKATLIRKMDDFEAVRRLGLHGQSAYGRGGVASKVEAARLASYSGVQTIIASGFRPNAILNAAGTLVPAKHRLPRRKRWIGFGSGYRGVIRVNAGAAEALTSKNASLLPSGIVEVRGRFAAEDVVSVETPDGREIGRGISYFSAEQVRLIQGCHTREIAERLGVDDRREVIHRDHLVVFAEG
jgi:glutamate 5-kinase